MTKHDVNTSQFVIAPFRPPSDLTEEAFNLHIHATQNGITRLTSQWCSLQDPAGLFSPTFGRADIEAGIHACALLYNYCIEGFLDVVEVDEDGEPLVETTLHEFIPHEDVRNRVLGYFAQHM